MIFLTEELARAVVIGFIGGLLQLLPEDIRESYITRAVKAIMLAPNNEQRELELTGIVNHIALEIQERM
jgi:predicted glycosyltransferase